MKNKELFTLNPDDNNLVNDGVVEINTAKDDKGLKSLDMNLKLLCAKVNTKKVSTEYSIHI